MDSGEECVVLGVVSMYHWAWTLLVFLISFILFCVPTVIVVISIFVHVNTSSSCCGVLCCCCLYLCCSNKKRNKSAEEHAAMLQETESIDMEDFGQRNPKSGNEEENEEESYSTIPAITRRLTAMTINAEESSHTAFRLPSIELSKAPPNAMAIGAGVNEKLQEHQIQNEAIKEKIASSQQQQERVLHQKIEEKRQQKNEQETNVFPPGRRPSNKKPQDIELLRMKLDVRLQIEAQHYEAEIMKKLAEMNGSTVQELQLEFRKATRKISQIK